MRKLTTITGYTAFFATAEETMILGGRGKCDECGKFAPAGYLIPVLNHYQCPECFVDWDLHSKFYHEDSEIEKKRVRYYEHMISVEGGSNEKTEQQKSRRFTS